jgi:hypothetical protein
MDRCEHPVGFVAAGMRGGWCIFHRNNPGMGREICVESKFFTRERYVEAARKVTYGEKDNPYVAALREALKMGREGRLVEKTGFTVESVNEGKAKALGAEVLAGSYQAEY